MEPSERKRLIHYILLLALVIGGMVYLNQLRKATAGKSFEDRASEEMQGGESKTEPPDMSRGS